MIRVVLGQNDIQAIDPSACEAQKYDRGMFKSRFKTRNVHAMAEAIFCTPRRATERPSTLANRAAAAFRRTRTLHTTAEGVETGEQRRIAKTLGRTEMQGYLFSHPKPKEAIAKFFASSPILPIRETMTSE